MNDPVVNDDVGAFTDPEFSALYDELVTRGMENYCEALQVGVDIDVYH